MQPVGLQHRIYTDPDVAALQAAEIYSPPSRMAMPYAISVCAFQTLIHYYYWRQMYCSTAQNAPHGQYNPSSASSDPYTHNMSLT